MEVELKAHLRRRSAEFPALHFIGERRAWWVDEIEAWEAEQMSRPASARRGAGRRTSTRPPGQSESGANDGTK